MSIVYNYFDFSWRDLFYLLSFIKMIFAALVVVLNAEVLIQNEREIPVTSETLREGVTMYKDWTFTLEEGYYKL